MPNLIDQSFFVREILIPNTNDIRVLERVNMYIERYEKECLMEVLGYYLYKAFMTEANGYYGRTVYGLTIKNDAQIQVGTTPGLVAGTNSFTFDGTGGTSDYRGYNLVISEINGRTILVKDVDFDWNYQTGHFSLLSTGDVFQPNQYYNIHFENMPFTITTNTPSVISQRMADLIFGKEYVGLDGNIRLWNGLVYDPKTSLIAYYIYYRFQHDNISQSTGIGTNIVVPEGTVAQSPKDKMLIAWNYMADEIKNLYYFLWSNNIVYPEFTAAQYAHGGRIFRRNTDFPF